MALVVALPPLGATFGFANVPAGMLAMIAIIAVVYLAAEEYAKRIADRSFANIKSYPKP